MFLQSSTKFHFAFFFLNALYVNLVAVLDIKIILTAFSDMDRFNFKEAQGQRTVPPYLHLPLLFGYTVIYRLTLNKYNVHSSNTGPSVLISRW